jgi:uncharacterized protein (DUF1330 family)
MAENLGLAWHWPRPLMIMASAAEKEGPLKALSRMALTLLVGIGLGGTTVEMLRAQTKQPVYFIYQTELTSDAASYAKNYVAHIPSTLEPFGGRFLVRGGKVTRVEGDAPLPRISIIEFDSLDKAQKWYNSPDYLKLIPVRQVVMKTNSFIAENPN